MNHYDVIVIGGGPAGMMATIQSGMNGLNTLLLEKNSELGKKLRLTGGGRCNVTNNCTREELLENIPRNNRFLYSSFHQFDNFDIMTFFNSINVPLKEEDHGRMFPSSNSAETIVNSLKDQIESLPTVTHRLSSTVVSILTNDTHITGVKLSNTEEILCDKVVIATGGKSYPQTGSTGDGYEFAKRVGHTIQPLFATEAPLLSEDGFVRDKTLQGLTLENAKVSVLKNNGKPLKSFQQSLLFTHFGLSGPAALRCSQFVNQLLQKQETVILSIDALPDVSPGELEKAILERKKNSPDKSIANALSTLVPKRYLIFLLENSNIDGKLPIKQLQTQTIHKIVAQLKGFQVRITGTWSLPKAFVTGGGITVKEINPKTMESKCIEGLYFAGEVMDVNAHTGGFNVTIALSTGFVAGSISTE